MTQIEQRYQHWHGDHEGIWRRRWVIASGTLQGCLQVKWLKRLVAGCWIAALGQMVLLFLYSQLVDSTSALAEWLGADDPRFMSIVLGLEAALNNSPELTVSVPWNLVFGFYSLLLFWPTMLVLTVGLTRVISRDLSSNAIVVYASKAVSRWDYFFGKLGAVIALMAITWLGPVLLAWFAGNMLAPSWEFFWLTRDALVHSVLFVLVGMAFLAALTMGISAVSENGKVVTFTWLVVWLLGWAMEGPAQHSNNQWLRHLSFRYNLGRIHTEVFNPGQGYGSLKNLRHDGEGNPASLEELMRVFIYMQDSELRRSHQRARRQARSENREARQLHQDEMERIREMEEDPQKQERMLNEKRLEFEESIQARRDAIVLELEKDLRAQRQRRFNGAVLGLGLMMTLAGGIVFQRLRPQ